MVFWGQWAFPKNFLGYIFDMISNLWIGILLVIWSAGAEYKNFGINHDYLTKSFYGECCIVRSDWFKCCQESEEAPPLISF